MASVETTNDEALVRERLKAEWLDCLTTLVESVEGWSRELGWSTRRIEKSLDDSEIGPYLAPALIMQEATTRALLDPIGRSTPGSDGVADLYLMPAFDDIARFYHRDGEWWLYHESPELPTNGAIEDVKPMSLSRTSLQGVLESMKKHAG
jgi:hypothetical protein